MDKVLKAEFVALAGEVEATAIPVEAKHTAAWCLQKLPSLYANYRDTLESRYGDEITRLVQAVMKELSQGKGGCQEAQKIASGMIGRFQVLHEQLSLPLLVLKTPPNPATVRTPKARAR